MAACSASMTGAVLMLPKGFGMIPIKHGKEIQGEFLVLKIKLIRIIITFLHYK